MFRNLGNMQFLQEMVADEDGPINPKKHRKAENIWKKGHKVIETAPDLSAFPSDVAITNAWEKGLQSCQDDLRKIGIFPENETRSDPKNKWFFFSHRIQVTTEREIIEQMQSSSENYSTRDIGLENDDIRSEPLNSEDKDDYSELAVHLRQTIADEPEHSTDGKDAQNSDTALIQVNISKPKVKLTVNVPCVGEVHKSTVFAMLNSNTEGV